MQLNIFLIARAIILLIALIFVCVGTGVAWYSFGEGSFKTKYFVYGARVGGTTIKWKDTGICDEAISRFDAGYAFGIISCLVIAATLVTVALQFFLAAFEKILKFASLGLAIAGFITTLITFAIGAGIYNAKLCGASNSFKDTDGKYDAGVPLFIVAWILMIADALIAAYRVFFGGSASVSIDASTEANTEIQ